MGKLNVNLSDYIPMPDSISLGNPAIDCLLALDDAQIPKQKIPESSLLLAFTKAVKRECEPTETRALPQIFVEEMKTILADPKPPNTHEIITATQTAIDELKEIGNIKGALVLSTSLMMLQSKFAKDAQNN